MANTENPYNQDYHNRPQMAGFGLRLAAAVLDGIIVAICLMVVIATFIPTMMSSDLNMGTLSDSAILGLGFTYVFGIPLFVILYQAFFESSSYQATPGKMALGIEVTDLDGRPLSFLRAFGRNAAKLVSRIIFYIGFIMAIWTEKEQALHDMIASTLVVRKERD